ncbi:MAG: gliding motility-associated C-terminal domain-containing protein [Bacteroidota bacterium]
MKYVRRIERRTQLAVITTLPLLGVALLTLASTSDLTPQLMSEICDNGIDDDMDGLIDLNDPECDCSVFAPVSLIPNPSFEDLACCPLSLGQIECAEAWVQASEPTTDFIHNCGWSGPIDYLPPQPFPDGDGILGIRNGRTPIQGETAPSPNWKEYAGACLFSPLLAGTSYRFEFDVGFSDRNHSPPVNITLYGTTDCENLPFGIGNVRLGCPTNGPNWVRLGASFLSAGAGDKWMKASIDVLPEEDIAAIVIGPGCHRRVSEFDLYYYLDNLLLDKLETFEFQISGTSHPCANDYLLEMPKRENTNYQWYKDGVSLVGETDHRLGRMYGEGNYQVVTTTVGNCQVSSTFTHRVPEIQARSQVSICQEDTYSFGGRELNTSGSYVHTFKSPNNCDSTVVLELTVLRELSETVNASVFEGEAYEVGGFKVYKEGRSDLTVRSSKGCDSLVLLDLTYYDVYLPPAFSPNNDGINDQFTVLGSDDLAEVVYLNIFDRWGNKIATGTEWDGRENGQLVSPGVFVYVVRLRMADGGERTFNGSVTVLY